MQSKEKQERDIPFLLDLDEHTRTVAAADLARSMHMGVNPLSPAPGWAAGGSAPPSGEMSGPSPAEWASGLRASLVVSKAPVIPPGEGEEDGRAGACSDGGAKPPG